MRKSIYHLLFLYLLICSELIAVEVVEYTVQPGDSVIKIAKAFGISPSVLMDWNPTLTESLTLRVGDHLFVPKSNVVKHVVKDGETLWKIAHIYSLKLGDIVRANGIVSPIIRPGDVLYIPWEKIGSILNNNSDIAWPLYGTISSGFGMRIHPITGKKSFHTGLDIAANEGSPVLASIDGIVVYAGYNGGYGYMVEISSGRYTTVYGHLSRICVYPGQFVKRGSLIGRVGSTGLSTGPHLHFEVKVSGQLRDPLAILPSRDTMFAESPYEPLPIGGLDKSSGGN
ncbi:MAG: hypothetical protein PWP37_39 [Thermotogota bacterium]|nr:hypothetical protein [Thermotogota bacterium]MDK2863847.1 hypothetical protein [Thermotogota bacterium]HCZ07383.1 peptidase [Thermotogota bacterium]